MRKSKKLRKLIKAAKMGKPSAQYRLGICYQTGHKVALDLQTAAEWIRISADSEYAPAKEWLADYVSDDNADTQANA